MMDTRGEPRLWLIGLTLPLALVAATMLGIASAPVSPMENTNSAMEGGIALLLGVFLLLCCLFVTVAVFLWHKSRVPLSAYHQLIATLPEEGEEETNAAGGM